MYRIHQFYHLLMMIISLLLFFLSNSEKVQPFEKLNDQHDTDIDEFLLKDLLNNMVRSNARFYEDRPKMTFLYSLHHENGEICRGKFYPFVITERNYVYEPSYFYLGHNFVQIYVYSIEEQKIVDQKITRLLINEERLETINEYFNSKLKRMDAFLSSTNLESEINDKNLIEDQQEHGQDVSLDKAAAAAYRSPISLSLWKTQNILDSIEKNKKKIASALSKKVMVSLFSPARFPDYFHEYRKLLYQLIPHPKNVLKTLALPKIGKSGEELKEIVINPELNENSDITDENIPSIDENDKSISLWKRKDLFEEYSYKQKRMNYEKFLQAILPLFLPQKLQTLFHEYRKFLYQIVPVIQRTEHLLPDEQVADLPAPLLNNSTENNIETIPIPYPDVVNSEISSTYEESRSVPLSISVGLDGVPASLTIYRENNPFNEIINQENQKRNSLTMKIITSLLNPTTLPAFFYEYRKLLYQLILPKRKVLKMVEDADPGPELISIRSEIKARGNVEMDGSEFSSSANNTVANRSNGVSMMVSKYFPPKDNAESFVPLGLALGAGGLLSLKFFRNSHHNSPPPQQHPHHSSQIPDSLNIGTSTIGKHLKFPRLSGLKFPKLASIPLVTASAKLNEKAQETEDIPPINSLPSSLNLYDTKTFHPLHYKRGGETLNRSFLKTSLFVSIGLFSMISIAMITTVTSMSLENLFSSMKEKIETNKVSNDLEFEKSSIFDEVPQFRPPSTQSGMKRIPDHAATFTLHPSIIEKELDLSKDILPVSIKSVKKLLEDKILSPNAQQKLKQKIFALLWKEPSERMMNSMDSLVSINYYENNGVNFSKGRSSINQEKNFVISVCVEALTLLRKILKSKNLSSLQRVQEYEKI